MIKLPHLNSVYLAGASYFILILALPCCTKKVGTNPSLAYTDTALYDSCASQTHSYYKNDAGTLLSGAAGPHGTFKLRFNAIAKNALTDNGKLPASAKFPEGAMIIKDVYRGGNLALYAFMYKRSGAWLWGEILADRSVQHSVSQSASVCTDCHSQSGNRDMVMSFSMY